MNQEELSYKKLERDIIEELGKLGGELLYRRGILATSKEDYVTARRLRFIADGLTLYCYTYQSRKYEQVIANPNVAVVIGFVQVEGIASDMGHPLDEKNAGFVNAFQRTQPEFYEGYKGAFEKHSNMFLIKVTPKRIALYKYANPEAGIIGGLYVLNITKGKAHRISDMTDLSKDHSEEPAYWE